MKRLYTTAAVERVCGLPRAVVRVWRHRGVLRDSMGRTAGWAVFTEDDMIRLAIAARIWRLGVPMRDAMPMVDRLLVQEKRGVGMITTEDGAVSIRVDTASIRKGVRDGLAASTDGEHAPAWTEGIMP